MNETAPQTGHINEREHHLPIRIYYEDTDFSGVVYHASYLRFMERGRTECLRLTGIGHKELLEGETPLAFAVRRMTIGFARPAIIDDVLDVQTCFTAARGARIEVQQKILRNGEVLVSAEIQIACIDLNGRPKRLPAALNTLLVSFLNRN